jgi:hypothetical protein
MKRSLKKIGKKLSGRWSILFLMIVILPACSYTPYVTNTKKSGTEQLLVSKALDEALKGLTLNIRGAKIYVQVASLMENEDYYIDKALTHWFLKNGALIAGYEKEADLTASVLVKCAGTDGDQYFFGIPSVPVPLFITSTPQITLLSGSNQEGRTELEVILYDSKEGLKEVTPRLIGKSYFKKFKMLFYSSTKEDIY